MENKSVYIFSRWFSLSLQTLQEYFRDKSERTKACSSLTETLQVQESVSYYIQKKKVNIHIVTELRNDRALPASALWRPNIIHSSKQKKDIKILNKI